MNPEFFELQEEDYTIVKEIYDYYILNSTATFHTTNIPLQELNETILINHPKYKSYLIRYDGSVCGYCYISQYKKRPAYDRTAEITIYLKPEYFGKGIGKIALEKLEAIAKNNGICVLIGIITGDNILSIGLFEKCGFEKCAHFKKVGKKFNKVLDVVAYQKIIEE